MGSVGRRSATYRAVRARFQQGDLVCHLCRERPGLTVDHIPPLSDFPHPDLWHGELRPACAPCQSRQGGKLAVAKRRRTSRRW